MIAKSAIEAQDQYKALGARDTRVAILLSTYNGAAFLREQLDSLIGQTYGNWVIHASDDGSSDETLEILRTYQKELGTDRLVIWEGPRRGFSSNFLSLLKRPSLDAAFFAYCDQDDVWAPNKLEQAMLWCQRIPQNRPALYCSRTQLIDEAGRPIGLSPLFRAAPTFRNALVQSIAGGNTMLFNVATRNLLMKTRDSDPIISHDWWTYLVVSGCGGIIEYDAKPSIGYRQHGKNLIGSNASFTDRLRRLRKMMAGTFKAWNDANLRAMTAIQPCLNDDSQQALVLFAQARQSNLFKRMILILRSGVYRQTLLGNLGLIAAAILQRL
ncbi:glycosyltransferase family 2 protein [Pseudomonas sp. PSE14]|uniref:glycosyltransferase family 2 protein n=1 Tax=Pseudomonas sp. PSE14 TaxID=3016341 RepID=UPI0023D7CE49|nr:glycosyltransferase family 2 protein [Pseudomonas sp. PSE14]WEJ71893.1 glycosyltransferase family 2 protein [Pseudomonas sp. PSE14]